MNSHTVQCFVHFKWGQYFKCEVCTKHKMMFDWLAGDAVLYGNTIDVFTCVETLMCLGVSGRRIHVVHPPEDNPTSCLPNGSVEHAVKQALEKEEVHVHHDCLLTQINDGRHTDPVTSVTFTTDAQTLRLECVVSETTCRAQKTFLNISTQISRSHIIHFVLVFIFTSCFCAKNTFPFKTLRSVKSLFCSPRLHLFEHEYSKNSKIVKLLQFKIAVFYLNIFIF